MVKAAEIFNTAFNVYTRLETIGEGGSGKVLKVADESGQTLALKHLLPDRLSTDKVKRFKNELSFCYANQHTNVIKVIDWGHDAIGGKKCSFYVMPYYPQNLRNLIGSGILVDQVLPYYSQILDGVEAAHLKGVWHRDLKPENILFDPRSKTLVIADFGIAHFEEQFLQTTVETSPHARLANFQYAAPEQRERGGIVDQRADIWALGLLLNELFTKKLAHGVGFTKIGDVNSPFGYLDELVDQMLKQSPAQRPSSIGEVKRVLIGRQNDFVQQQKLSQLKQAVIPDTEIDDPLVLDPPKLVDAKWDNGSLILRLSRSVNTQWVNCFHNPGGHTAILGKGPETFRIGGNIATIDSEGREAEALVNYTKEYIAMANRNYRSLVESSIKKWKAQEEAELKRKIALEEQTREINKRLKV